jgi:hypothetical protein
MTLHPAKSQEFSVRIRVPNRGVSHLYSGVPDANGITSISVNGTAVTPVMDRGYAVIQRTWKPGDQVDLVFPMKVQRVKASDRIAADRGRVALRYGPLVYCIEGIDQDIRQVLSPQVPLTTEWKPDLLGGVMVLKGTFANGSAMTAIPYYARNNRGLEARRRSTDAGCTVWVKDQ